MIDDESRVSFILEEHRLREALQYAKTTRELCQPGSAQYAQWQRFVDDYQNRLDLHLLSRTTQQTLEHYQT